MTRRGRSHARGWRSLARLLLLAGLAVAVGGLVVGPRPAAADPSPCPTYNPPNRMVLAGGSPQTAKLRTAFAASLQVAVANYNRCPLTTTLAGTLVTFSAPTSGPSGTFSTSGSNAVTVGTDSSGAAVAPPFTANDIAGSYTVVVTSVYGTVLFSLTNTASGLAASIAATGTSSQEATVNSQYAQPLQARVLDANGHPVQGATVSFSIATGPTGAGAGFLGGGQATAITDSNGLATSPPLLANGTPGRFTGAASTDGLSSVATYSLDNHAAATTITATATTDPVATAAVDTRYELPLQARVLDASGQPVEGASVTFTITAAESGAGAGFVGGATQANELTDANGQATSPPLLANKTAGDFTAAATTVANVQPVSYKLQNLAAAPDAVTVGAATGQSTPAGSRFPIRLAVTVTDKNGNPVSGATVSFTAPAHGPGGRFTVRPSERTQRHANQKPRLLTRRIVRVATDSKGIAIAPPFTANGKAGGYTVTAIVEGTSKRAAFALVNQPRQ